MGSVSVGACWGTVGRREASWGVAGRRAITVIEPAILSISPTHDSSAPCVVWLSPGIAPSPPPPPHQQPRRAPPRPAAAPERFIMHFPQPDGKPG